MKAPLSIDRHSSLRTAILLAERSATVALSLTRHMTAEEVAEAVARRAIDALHEKREQEAAAEVRGGD